MKKIINMYFESKEVSIRTVSDPNISDIIIKEDGTITTVLSNLEVDISDMLINLGMPTNIRGFCYICEALKIIVNDPGAISFVTKNLYPCIAEIFNTTPSGVERAIRTAIRLAWSEGNKNLKESIFKTDVSIGKVKPTNSEFLLAASEQIRFAKYNIE